MESNQNFGNRTWGIWGPLVMKMGISMVIYFIAAGFATAFYLAREGADSQMLMTALSNPEEYQNIVLGISEILMSFAVPVEGVAALLTIPLFLFLMHRDKRKEKERGLVLILQKAQWWKYPAIILLAAAMCMGLNNLIILGNLSAYSASYEETMEVLYEPSFGLQILCLGILLPICEELTFRGLIYRRMRREMKFLGAALYSGLIFGITHGNLVQGIYGMAMGIMFAYVYDKYGSVWAPVTAHIAANLVSLFGTQYHWFDWLFADVLHVGVVTVGCAFVASTVYVIMQRMDSTFSQIPAAPERREDNGRQE